MSGEGGSALTEIKTAPYDYRFPTQNQARHCFARYCEYFKCMEQTSDEERCSFYKRAFKQLCPNDWIEKWDDARSKGIFPVGNGME